MKIGPQHVTPEEWRALDAGSVAHIRAGTARFQVSGKGAMACVQGLVTCDVHALPAGSRAFGALLTSKGMIVTLLWIEKRAGELLLLETTDGGAAALRDVLQRSIPPRLATWEDVTASTVGLGIYGPAGTGTPRAVARGADGVDLIVAPDVAERTAAAHTRASDALMEACRILAGIPALGAEIDEKTLPQEVRFDELGGVSYTKGCYVGQETVARVHFRGHPNRRLVMLLLEQEPEALPLQLTHDGKGVGRLTSAAWSHELDAWVAQAVIRREVEDGARLEVAGGTGATVAIERWPRAA